MSIVVTPDSPRSTAEILATAPPAPKKHHTKSGGTRSEWDRWYKANRDELEAARKLEPPYVENPSPERWRAQCPPCGRFSPWVGDKRTALQAIESCRHGATS